ncbi:MAG: porin, partial [Planctomycetota bacterium]
MNRLLIGVSSVAIAATGTANAAEWNVRVGGFSTQMVGYASVDAETLPDDDFDGVDTLSNTEIIFRPSITLDNGITFGVQVQLEGNTSGDQIDESFASIDSSFGRVLIGSENSAGSLMTFAAPCVALTCHNSGTLTAYIPYSGSIGGGVITGSDAFRGTLGSTFLENVRNNDVGRITYFTPRIAGAQLGFSYARDFNEDDDSQANLADDFGDIIDIGANYVQTFGGVDIGVSARWGIIATTPAATSDNPTVYSFGATASFAGVTVGGSFAEQNNSLRAVAAGASNPGGFASSDGTAFDVGISYETGPWGVSFSYLRGENVDDESINGAGIAGGDETADKFVAGINYSLAQGVDLGLVGAYVDFEEDNRPNNAFGPPVIPGDDVDGFLIGTGVAL